jgi:hypothetical protein
MPSCGGHQSRRATQSKVIASGTRSRAWVRARVEPAGPERADGPIQLTSELERVVVISGANMPPSQLDDRSPGPGRANSVPLAGVNRLPAGRGGGRGRRGGTHIPETRNTAVPACPRCGLPLVFTARTSQGGQHEQSHRHRVRVPGRSHARSGREGRVRAGRVGIPVRPGGSLGRSVPPRRTARHRRPAARPPHLGASRQGLSRSRRPVLGQDERHAQARGVTLAGGRRRVEQLRRAAG